MLKYSRAIRGFSSLLILAVVLVLYVTQDGQELRSGQRFKRSAAAKEANDTNVSYKRIKAWIASSISVFIISAVGLLGVAVVPLVQKVFYNKIIQYLVALAVGSLTGDAFLHLMPHAMLAGKNEEEEFTSVMKGLVALGGVFFFFFAEKVLSMVSEYGAEKRAEEEERQRQLKDPRRSEIRRLSAINMSTGSAGNRRGSHMANTRDSAMFRRLSKVTSNENDDDNIITTGLSSRAMKSIDNLIRFAELDVEEDHLGPGGYGAQSGFGGTHLLVPGTTVTYQPPENEDQDEKMDGEIQLMVPSPGYKQKAIEDKHEEGGKHDSNTALHVTIVSTKDNERKLSHEDENVEVREKKGGHGHGHSHEVPGSIAAVAWMVILGDGLHNFSDGLAIGAAFATGIGGGFSTAVAVFCHELPHELGDFAVLLKTGMKVKQALFYNIVSSALSFMGMCIGIALVNVESASYWIFAVTAGTFVYIALVDMLPELNSVEVRPGESRVMHMLIQVFGLASGVGVMLLIAIFEENIKEMLS